MSSKTERGRVWIDKKGDTLRLRWRFEGKVEQISLGVKDTVVGNKYANMIAAQIDNDLESGHYDSTKDRYRTRKRRSKPEEQPDKITAVKLFEKYAEYKLSDRQLCHSSTIRFKGIASKLNQLLGDKLLANRVSEAVAKEAIARWSESASTRTIKERLYDLQSCWNWAKDKYHLADPNPWAECLDCTLKKAKKTQPKRQKPFTIAELQAIIAAFAAHPQYKHYTEFVIFLAHTACRPGEVVSLRYKHLGADFSTAWIGESISRGHQNAHGTKTGKSRTIQLSPTVRRVLLDRHERLNPAPTDLVFPSPKGFSIDDHNFCNRAWKTILTSCQVEYRSPYQIRHSAISQALHQGANPIALAEQTGHDKRVLLSTYAVRIQV